MTPTNHEARSHEPTLLKLKAELDALSRLMEEQEKHNAERFDAQERLMTERDRLYKERSDAQKEAVAAALAANKELTNNAFLSSEKAIGKAESAQTDYNSRSNEFRQALDDSNKDKLSRAEAEGRFNGVAERVDELKKEFEKYQALQAIEIRSLRESRSQDMGIGISTERRTTQTNFTVSHAIAVAGILISLTIAMKFL